MKIMISGKGGHGVKFGAQVLGKILASKGKQVSVSYEYDAAIRGQNITAFIVVSDSQILNPIVEKADVEFNTKNFEKVASREFGAKIYVTMMILGKILKKLEIKIGENEFKAYMKKEKDNNWKALNYYKEK